MPGILGVQSFSKTGKIYMPLTGPATLPAKVPAFYPFWLNNPAPSVTDADPCCQTQDFTAGPSSGGGTFPWASSTGPPNSGTFTISVVANGDNGDGTWDCVVTATAVVTSGSGSVGGIIINTPWGGNYSSGDHMPVPYLQVILNGVTVSGPDGILGSFDGTGHPSDFYAPGFLYWNDPYDFVNDVVWRDRLRWDPTVNGTDTYCTQPVTLTGEVDYIFFKYAITVVGLTPGTSNTIYLHFDGDDHETGVWTTDEYELQISFVASAETEIIETLGLPCAWATVAAPICCCCCCCTPPFTWPNPLGKTRLNRVDFTP